MWSFLSPKRCEEVSTPTQTAATAAHDATNSGRRTLLSYSGSPTQESARNGSSGERDATSPQQLDGGVGAECPIRADGSSSSAPVFLSADTNPTPSSGPAVQGDTQGPPAPLSATGSDAVGYHPCVSQSSERGAEGGGGQPGLAGPPSPHSGRTSPAPSEWQRVLSGIVQDTMKSEVVPASTGGGAVDDAAVEQPVGRARRSGRRRGFTIQATEELEAADQQGGVAVKPEGGGTYITVDDSDNDDSAPVGAQTVKGENGDRKRGREGDNQGTGSASGGGAAPVPPRRVEATDPLATLSDEQREAYHLVVRDRRSVFITGGAGTGKSHLLRTIIKGLPRATTYVTATTGIAALNLGGTTVHSFAGCGIVEEGDDWSKIAMRIKRKAQRAGIWRRCRVLVIDEVSMLSAFMFDMLEYLARYLRGNFEPFGGIQLVLTGDFLQLPPVRRVTARRPQLKGPSFPFESETWLRVNPQVCLLSKPFRQRDNSFFHLLNEMRFGEMSTATIDTLSDMSDVSRVNLVTAVDTRSVDTSTLRVADMADAPAHTQYVFSNQRGTPLQRDFDGFTNLRAKRDEVDQQNDYYYNNIDPAGNPQYVYQGCHYGQGEFPENSIQKTVRLRVGCRVMLIKNIDVTSGLVNGSTGTVTGFVSCAKGYEFKSGTGITRQEALAVCRGVEGDMKKSHAMLPCVNFDLPLYGTTMTTVVEPYEWKEERGEEVLSRTHQMPLILAYAITIHKSQGMSLSDVDIDLKSVFEAGQAYVALSRCTDLQRVRLHGFSADKVNPASQALAYYKALELYRKRIEWQRRRDMSSREAHAQLQGRAGTGAAEAGATPLSEEDARRRQPFTSYGYESNGAPTPRGATYRSSSSSEAEGEEERGRGSGDGGRRGSPHSESSNAHRALLTTESTHLDELRQYVLQMLTAAQDVNHQLLRLATPATRVRDARLVLDTTAFFYLMRGRNSVRVFNQVTNTNGNMLRLPQVVKSFLSNIADAVSAPHGEAGVIRTKGARGGGGGEDGPGARHALIDAAAEALAVIDDWKANFVLDEQRSGEDLPLLPQGGAVVLPAWHSYAPLLPLLQHLIPGRGSDSGREPSRGAAPEVSEVSFLLNRDPREAATHEGILRYALYLRRTGGPTVGICTDSPTLAAYALALDFAAVTVGALAGDSR